MNGLLIQRAPGQRALGDALQRAPLGWFSGAIGWISRRTLPRPIRRPLYTAFARAWDVELAEVERPLEEYPTFGDFFARRLRAGLRPGEADAGTVVSPCDGHIAARGLAGAGGEMIQAKGRDYRLADLLADDALAADLDGGTYLTFYLSPRDYHRVHSPVTGQLLGYHWVPGTHLPVSPRFLSRLDRVFARNERVIFRLSTAVGPVALVMVAATGVGNIAISATGIDSRGFRSGGRPVRVDLDEPLPVERGQELGAFHLGSTVVAVFPRGAIELHGLGLPGDHRPIHVGEPVAIGMDRRR